MSWSEIIPLKFAWKIHAKNHFFIILHETTHEISLQNMQGSENFGPNAVIANKDSNKLVHISLLTTQEAS